MSRIASLVLAYFPSYIFYLTTSKGQRTRAWHVSAIHEAATCWTCTFRHPFKRALLCKKYLLNSYESQNVAAHGKEAAIAEANPLNLLTVSAYFTKSTFCEVACKRVLIESIGKSTKSIDVPAIPPDITAVRNVLNVNFGATTCGLYSAISVWFCLNFL